VGGVALLREARAAGLAVSKEGHKLVVQGPARLEALALRLWRTRVRYSRSWRPRRPTLTKLPKTTANMRVLSASALQGHRLQGPSWTDQPRNPPPTNSYCFG
jgi:hypothetical protein